MAFYLVVEKRFIYTILIVIETIPYSFQLITIAKHKKSSILTFISAAITPPTIPP
ncbi:hypothetical protein HanPI659440_Chr15g0591541 [Helianthus annuus]|nr:hypothetical protein HanPI659440_Chr15g0591541 [Helianthus annuus]